MQEKLFEITEVRPIELFGVNDSKLKLIRQYFPKLKFVTRDNVIKVSGEPDVIDYFEKKLDLLIRHISRYNTLSEGNIESLLLQKEEGSSSLEDGDVIVHGQGGLQVKARTPNQRKLVRASAENDMVFALGPAGTGKTYTAVALAVRALKNKEVRRIILTRPAVEAGENLGFLPGDMRDKLDPYLQPLYDALRDMIPAEKLAEHFENGVIQIAPLAFMRGRTLSQAVVILDEAQNTTPSQMKMFLTRLGQGSVAVVTGDVTQNDLPQGQRSGLIDALERLHDVSGIAEVEFSNQDVVRSEIVGRIIAAYERP